MTLQEYREYSPNRKKFNPPPYIIINDYNELKLLREHWNTPFLWDSVEHSSGFKNGIIFPIMVGVFNNGYGDWDLLSKFTTKTIQEALFLNAIITPLETITVQLRKEIAAN